MASNKPPVLGGEMRNVTVYLLRHRRLLLVLGERCHRASWSRLMNEYLSAMTDIIEAARRLRRQIHRRRDRRGVRRAARRPGSRRQRACARRCNAAAPPRRAQPRRRRVPGPTVAAAHRAQLRRGAGRQYRLAPALQLHGDGRHGEPRLAARGRQQVFRHHDPRLGDDDGADRRRRSPGASSTPSASRAARTSPHL